MFRNIKKGNYGAGQQTINTGKASNNVVFMVKQNGKIEDLKDKTSSNKKKRVENILGEMQVKLNEIDSLRKELAREKYNSITPKESKEMLEEIKVPSIELIRDEKKKH